jgi:hypothetical protein
MIFAFTIVICYLSGILFATRGASSRASELYVRASGAPDSDSERSRLIRQKNWNRSNADLVDEEGINGKLRSPSRHVQHSEDSRPGKATLRRSPPVNRNSSSYHSNHWNAISRLLDENTSSETDSDEEETLAKAAAWRGRLCRDSPICCQDYDEDDDDDDDDEYEDEEYSDCGEELRFYHNQGLLDQELSEGESPRSVQVQSCNDQFYLADGLDCFVDETQEERNKRIQYNMLKDRYYDYLFNNRECHFEPVDSDNDPHYDHEFINCPPRPIIRPQISHRDKSLRPIKAFRAKIPMSQTAFHQPGNCVSRLCKRLKNWVKYPCLPKRQIYCVRV